MYFRFKDYTKEDIEGKELSELSTYSWKNICTIKPITVTKITDKTVLYGSSRLPIKDVGLLKYSSIIVPREDVEETFDAFIKAQIKFYENSIQALQENIEETKIMTLEER